MKILHIAVGYNYSNLYKNLFSYIGKKNVKQVVYVPEHKRKENDIEKKEEIIENVDKIIRSQVITPIERVFFMLRKEKILKDIINKVDLSEITFIHAHSLFSDGIVAYNLYKNYGIPYIVAVRDTDINKYYKFRPYLKKSILEVLENAEKIIFLSEAYSRKVSDLHKGNKLILEKTEIIPNGIDDFWLDNGELKPKEVKKDELNLIFVGKLIKRKNLKKVIEVVKYLDKEVIKTKLTIIGDGPLLDSYKAENASSQNIQFYGSEKNKEKLKEIYKKNDILVVPSFTETFGLVYPEAMSNGLPVIYTIDQGFDKQFENGEIGYPVDPNNISSISDSIVKIINNYNQMSLNCIRNYKKFNWDEIAEKYIYIYNAHNRKKG